MARNSNSLAEHIELEQLYDHAPVGLCFMDCELRFVRINKQMAAINGAPVEAHIGRTLRDIIPKIADHDAVSVRGNVVGESIRGVGV